MNFLPGERASQRNSRAVWFIAPARSRRYAARRYAARRCPARRRGSPSSQTLDSPLIECGSIVLSQGVHEDLIVIGSMRKQRHRRLEFQVIRIAEDVLDGSAVDRRDQPGAFSEPRSKLWVIQVFRRFPHG